MKCGVSRTRIIKTFNNFNILSCYTIFVGHLYVHIKPFVCLLLFKNKDIYIAIYNINYVIYYLKDYLYYFWLYFYHDFSTQCNYYYSFLFIVIVVYSFYGYLLIVHCLLYFFLIYGLIFVLLMFIFGIVWWDIYVPW